MVVLKVIDSFCFDFFILKCMILAGLIVVQVFKTKRTLFVALKSGKIKFYIMQNTNIKTKGFKSPFDNIVIFFVAVKTSIQNCVFFLFQKIIKIFINSAVLMFVFC
jgi:hypothetical protein